MKPKISAIIASALLVTGCGDWDAASHRDAPSKGAFDGPESKEAATYGLFIKSPNGKTKLETVHGPFSDLDACQVIANAYNNGTYDARLPGIYACEPVSGTTP